MPAKPNLRGWAIVATYISPGVARGGAGIAIVNGKIVKIPPRGPVTRQLQEAIAQLGKRR
jgi:hypothetical protein